MGFFGGMRDWSERKKRGFALGVAALLTIVLAGGWFAYGRMAGGKTGGAKDDFSALSAAFRNIAADWNAAGQVAASATARLNTALAAAASSSATSTSAATASTSASSTPAASSTPKTR